MNTNDIQQILAHDVFSSDFNVFVLPSNHLRQQPAVRPAFYIINASPCSHPGSHWLVVYLPKDKQRRGEWFCSYGVSPEEYRLMTEDFEKFYKNNLTDRCLYTSVQLQSVNSSYCGLYAILFVLFRSRNLSYADLMHCFTDNPVVNDDIVHNVFLSYNKTHS